MTLSFKPLFEEDKNTLQENFLPIALDYLRGEDSRSRVIFDRSSARFIDPQIVPFSSENLFGSSDRAISRDSSDLIIGPSITLESLDLSVEELSKEQVGERPQVAVIDIGIAFWHPRFRRGKETVFVAVVFVQFNAGEKVLRSLSPDEIASYIKLFDTEGNTAVLEKLGRDFPDSIYTRRELWPSLRQGDFAHGTSMADVVLHGDSSRGAPSTCLEDDPAMIAVELPAEIYLDRNGDQLHNMALFLVEKTVELMSDETPRRLLLPFAYLRGPIPDTVDDRARFHNAIEKLLANKDARLYLPMGNFRQSQLHARIADQLEAGDWSTPMIWQLPIADPSRNCLSVNWQGADTIGIKVQPPHGHDSVTQINIGEAQVLLAGKTVAGAVHAFVSQARNSLRFALPRTQPVPGGEDPALAGQWTIEVRGIGAAMRNVTMTILRDDPPGLGGLQRHNRQSFFVDPAYRRRRPDGKFEMGDNYSGDVRIRRTDTVSHLVLGDRHQRSAIVAIEREGTGARVAPYSGALANPVSEVGVSTAEVGSSRRPWITALRNGTNSFGALSGTSAAAALALHADLRNGGGG